MRTRQLHSRPSVQVLQVGRLHDLVPRLREPFLHDEGDADDEQMEVWRAACLWLKLPHGPEAGELARQALIEGIQMALPQRPVTGPRLRIGQGDKEQAAADVRYWDRTERLLQAGARAAAELADLAPLVGRRLLAGTSETTPKLCAGAAAGRRDTRVPSRGEVWTVDKPRSPRFAVVTFERRQRACYRGPAFVTC